MVEKRRQEEEEIIAQEMKANAKRKKFKEVFDNILYYILYYL